MVSFDRVKHGNIGDHGHATALEMGHGTGGRSYWPSEQIVLDDYALALDVSDSLR